MKMNFTLDAIATTEQMIESLSVVQKGDVVLVKWKKPQILPEFYILQGWCHSKSSEETYTMPRIEVPSSRIVTPMPVTPGSFCEITLIASYKSGSTDPGISTSFETPNKGEFLLL